MNKHFRPLFFLATIFFMLSCAEEKTNEDTIYTQDLDEPEVVTEKINLLSDIEPINDEGVVRVIIEIPSGTSDIWALDKKSGELTSVQVNGVPQVLKYIGSPGNLGVIPRTMVSNKMDGDGGSLEILVLGPPVKRGAIVNCKILGVLHLKDNGEKENKLIAVSYDSPFYRLRNMEELNDQYNGVSSIIKTWFNNYKGSGKTKVIGFGNTEKAHEILKSAMAEYKSANP